MLKSSPKVAVEEGGQSQPIGADDPFRRPVPMNWRAQGGERRPFQREEEAESCQTKLAGEMGN